MRRLRIFILLAALPVLVAAFFGCGGGGSSEDPREILDGVSFEGVESGNLDGALKVESTGKASGESGDLDASLSASFQQEDEALPWLGVTAAATGTARGKEVDFKGGLTLLSDHGFVSYQGTGYEIDPSNFEFAKSIFLPPAPGQNAESDGGALGACRESISRIQPSELVENPSYEGTAEVEGVSTTRVSGGLDVPRLIDALEGVVVVDPACLVQLEAVAPLSLPELREAGGKLARVEKKAHVDVYVDEDGIIRKLTAELAGVPKGGSSGGIAVDLELSLREVNEDQKIAVPSGAKPLTALFSKLGINPLEFLTLAPGGKVVRSLLEKVAADLSL